MSARVVTTQRLHKNQSWVSAASMGLSMGLSIGLSKGLSMGLSMGLSTTGRSLHSERSDEN